jgi:hypothetical protein
VREPPLPRPGASVLSHRKTCRLQAWLVPGPKLVPLILPDAERASLVVLSRKRAASQSLAERARVVPAGADEDRTAPLTRVAARTGLSRESAASGGCVHGGPDGRPRGRAAARSSAQDHRRAGRSAGHAHAHPERRPGRTVTGRPGRWPPGRDCRSRRSRGSGGPSASSARRRDVQAEHRPGVHRPGPRRRGPLHEPARARPGLPVDDKSPMQALDRTAPCLPMLPTTPERRTHDYARHGRPACPRL